MRTIYKISVITGLGLILPFTASAQSIQDMKDLSPEDKRAFMESMSEDERQAMRGKWRSEYENLSDEEKQAMRAELKTARGERGQRGNREARRERWGAMSEEDRAAAKERRKAGAAERRARWDAMSEDERDALRENRKRHQRQKSQGHRDQEPPPESSE